MININTTWTQNIKNKDEKKEFEKVLLESKRVVDRLKEIVERELEICEKDSLAKINYHRPNWAQHQADRIGQKRTLKKLLNIVTLEK